jgi:xanthine dehydrogenase accessory factor
MASAVAWRIFMSNIRKVLMLETVSPLAVRREVSFCEAVHEGRKTVEGIEALKVEDYDGARKAWAQGKIAVVIDPEWELLNHAQANVVVDAILAKKNTGTHIKEAPLVIGLGPGFVAGEDVHLVIETNRGHNLGRIITCGIAEPNTGIPGPIQGYTEERVLRAPCDGVFNARLSIGSQVNSGDPIGAVEEETVLAKIDGVIRGLIRSSSKVRRGSKIGDIDPRGCADYCYTISEKARAISGSVLEAILRVFN